MIRSHPKNDQPFVRTRPFDYWRRLKEIDMFFAGCDAVHQTLRRLTNQLHESGISYAIVGGLAVNAHGVHRTTEDVDVLLTPKGLDGFRRQFVDTAYTQMPRRSRRFLDRQNYVRVDVQLTGHYPGWQGPGPFAFPDPRESSVEMDQVYVLTLDWLLQLKLAARRYCHSADVVQLIRTHNLDESFLEKLHPAVHRDFIECLEEKRREDEYETQQDQMVEQEMREEEKHGPTQPRG